jgi:hypothetical protein
MDFKKLPTEVRNELIDLSGLSDEEIIEKMKEIFSENSGEPMTLDPHEAFQGLKDEGYDFPQVTIKNGYLALDKKVIIDKIKSLKKKTPAYVEQFGVNKRSRR